MFDVRYNHISQSFYWDEVKEERQSDEADEFAPGHRAIIKGNVPTETQLYESFHLVVGRLIGIILVLLEIVAAEDTRPKVFDDPA